MLKHLFVENYILIQKLDLFFNEGFTCITGETGAGKSILLGALSLILGERADKQALFNKDKKCIVEAEFDIKTYHLESFFTAINIDYEEYTLIRREIYDNGKSRAFINDTPVQLTQLKEIGEQLVDIHSQNKTTALNENSFQMSLVDNFAGNNQLLEEYQKKFKIYISNKQHLQELIEKEKKSKAEQDYHQFLFDELYKATLKIGETEILEKEINVLLNGDNIKTGLFRCLSLLYENDNATISQLSEVKNTLNQISPFHEGIKSINFRIESLYIELKDIVNEIEQLSEHIAVDPQTLSDLQYRLDLIYRLMQKHQVKTDEELINIQNSISNKLLDITTLEEEINTITKQTNNQYNELFEIAKSLSSSRNISAREMEFKLKETFSQLGMPQAEISIEVKPVNDINKSGADIIEFLFSANKGHNLRELNKVASGGEMSRLMLSLKSLISQRSLIPTLILDEIDSGVSGDIAAKAAQIMQNMSKAMQIIAITHLPQIAAKADTHLSAIKSEDNGKTISLINILNNNQRIEELAKMLSNEQITDAAMRNAKELLNY